MNFYTCPSCSNEVSCNGCPSCGAANPYIPRPRAAQPSESFQPQSEFAMNSGFGAMGVEVDDIRTEIVDPDLAGHLRHRRTLIAENKRLQQQIEDLKKALESPIEVVYAVPDNGDPTEKHELNDIFSAAGGRGTGSIYLDEASAIKHGRHKSLVRGIKDLCETLNDEALNDVLRQAKHIASQSDESLNIETKWTPDETHNYP